MRLVYVLFALAAAGCALVTGPPLANPGGIHTLKIRLWSGEDLRREALRMRQDREWQSRDLGAAIRSAAREGRARPYRSAECSSFAVRFENANYALGRGKNVTVNDRPESIPADFGPRTEFKVPVCSGEGRLAITTEWLLANVAVKIQPPAGLRIVYPADGRTLGTCTMEEIRAGYRRCPAYEERYRQQGEFFAIVRFEEGWDRMSNYHFAADEP